MIASTPQTSFAPTPLHLKVGDAAIPKLGFGTYGMSGQRLQSILVAALNRGFRHIDTAQMYRNERDVGASIRMSGLPRQDVFVTTNIRSG
jgi:2,5-diketo-D-gluconate reductase B